MARRAVRRGARRRDGAERFALAVLARGVLSARRRRRVPVRFEATMTREEKLERFRALHARSGAFIIPNPWDAGSARVLAGLGFPALATSSGASAWTRGKLDGAVTRDEALAHCRAIVEAVDLPVSADLEKCFADEPRAAAETIRLAAGVCQAVSKPVNFMVGLKGKSFSVAELEAAGVRRISLATSLYREALSSLVAAAREVKEKGSFDYVARSLPSAELAGFMKH